MGRPNEARAIIQTIEPALEKMPISVVGDEHTVYGWPEHCLRHTESYVYSHIGDSARARRAQDRALVLYPSTEQRSRTLVVLHQAMCMVKEGYVDNGSDFATAAINGLPAAQRTALVLDIGLRVAQTVPDAERARSSVAGLREVLALSAGPRNAI